MRSKSCVERMNDVAAIPTAPKANATSSAAGTARMAHGEANSPSRTMTHEEPDRIQPAADERPAELAERDVTRRQRRRRGST